MPNSLNGFRILKFSFYLCQNPDYRFISKVSTEKLSPHNHKSGSSLSALQGELPGGIKTKFIESGNRTESENHVKTLKYI